MASRKIKPVSLTRKIKEKPFQTLDRWIAGESRQHRAEVMEHFGSIAGNGLRIVVDGITFEKVDFKDCEKFDHLGSGYVVLEIGSDGACM